MQAVQSPIIQEVADLVRQHPGTISLGQGVVYYGPPPEAIDQITQFLANPKITFISPSKAFHHCWN